jgi:hypothetical protein
MKARLKRPFPEYGVSMEWYGGWEVVVVSHERELYRVPLFFAGIQTASEAIDLERDRMAAACQGCC